MSAPAGSIPTWLKWLAGAVTAPAFIAAAVFFGIFLFKDLRGYYQHAGSRVLITDVSMFGTWLAFHFLKSRICSKWILWLACVGVATALSITLWIPALAKGPAPIMFAVFAWGDLISATPLIQRWKAKRAESGQKAPEVNWHNLRF